MSETLITALIMAAATIVAALITARAYKKAKSSEAPDSDESRNRVEKVRSLLVTLDQLNIKVAMNTARSAIGDFDFSDISATKLEPGVQALICKGDGGATGRWSNDVYAINRLEQARMVNSAIELNNAFGGVTKLDSYRVWNTVLS